MPVAAERLPERRARLGGHPRGAARPGAGGAVQRRRARRGDHRGQHADELAAVIVEPLERVLVPGPGFLQALREVTRKHGIVLIFDEVVTGFRIAWGGAQERYGVVPDLATYGKAMSGGFPMAAIAGRSDVMAHLDARRIERAKLVWASGTLNGNPISATAGLAALDVLARPGAYDQLHQIGGRLRREIKAIGARYGFAAQTPGEDAVFGVRFTEREDLRSWADLLTADKDLGPALGDRAAPARHPGQPEREVLHLDRAHRRRRRPHPGSSRRRVQGVEGLAIAHRL